MVPLILGNSPFLNSGLFLTLARCHLFHVASLPGTFQLPQKAVQLVYISSSLNSIRRLYRDYIEEYHRGYQEGY